MTDPAVFIHPATRPVTFDLPKFIEDANRRIIANVLNDFAKAAGLRLANVPPRHDWLTRRPLGRT